MQSETADVSPVLPPGELAGARSASPRVQAALGKPIVTIQRVYGCHMPNVMQIRSKLWPCINKKTDRHTDIFGFI